MNALAAAAFVAGAALLLAGVALKRADQRACDFADDTHQEDQ